MVTLLTGMEETAWCDTGMSTTMTATAKDRICFVDTFSIPGKKHKFKERKIYAWDMSSLSFSTRYIYVAQLVVKKIWIKVRQEESLLCLKMCRTEWCHYCFRLKIYPWIWHNLGLLNDREENAWKHLHAPTFSLLFSHTENALPDNRTIPETSPLQEYRSISDLPQTQLFVKRSIRKA